MGGIMTSETKYKKCVFLSSNIDEIDQIKNLLENNNYDAIVEDIKEFGEIEYSIIVDSKYYDEIGDLIENNVKNINDNNLQNENSQFFLATLLKKETIFRFNKESTIFYFILSALVFISFFIVFLVIK
jgi:hypothetical protein